MNNNNRKAYNLKNHTIHKMYKTTKFRDWRSKMTLNRPFTKLSLTEQEGIITTEKKLKSIIKTKNINHPFFKRMNL